MNIDSNLDAVLSADANLIQPTLNKIDEQTVEDLESSWFNEAEQFLATDENWDAIRSEWAAWLNYPVAYRLAAYYTMFGGDFQNGPMLLWSTSGWYPGSAATQLENLFADKVEPALGGPDAPVLAASSGGSSLGMIALVAIGLFFLARR